MLCLLVMHIHERLSVLLLIVFCSAEGVILSLHGSKVTVDWFNENGFGNPIVVDRPEGLGVKVPPSDFTVADVEQYVG